jgi:DHA3 family macrolide efflux protein-like MFS transporter
VIAERSWTKRFFTIWTGQAFSIVGSQLVQFALIWWLTIETGSATVLTIASIMGILPQVIITPLAGTYVDRWKRRRVMIAADGLTALVTFALMISFALGSESVPQIMVVLLLRSTFSAFHWPAMQASTTLMVPEDHLVRVSGLNESVRGLGSIAAPPLGAVLIAILPMQWVLSVDLFTAAIAILTLVLVTIPEVRRAEGRTTSVRADLREAFIYLASWKGAVWLMVIFMFINFLINPAFALLPLLTLKHFGLGAIEYAAMESMAGLGMIVGGLVLGVWGGAHRKIVTCMAATGICGLGVGLIGVLPPEGYLLAVASCLLVGVTLSIINGSIVAIMQKGIRADMQGRALALLNSGVAAMSPAGLLLAGPISDTIGIQVWFIIGGVAMVFTALVSIFIPAIMRMEDREVEKVELEQLPPA